MKFISLFAGVGGFDEGMRRAGHECVAMVEWDKAAAGVLSYRYPDVPLYCDVSKVEVDDLPDCDFLTYGFPCQDLSVAGKRKGLEGERSGLFFEATRLIRGLHARGSRFRFAVAENVKGLFSADDGLAFARCIRELQQCGASEIGWSVYDSQYFGLAQRRKRVFIVSDFGGSSCDQILAVTESLSGNPAPEREAWKGAPAGVGSGFTPSSYGGYERGCGTLRSEGGDIGGGSETLAVAGTLDSECGGNKLTIQSALSGPLVAQGADVYNGEVTGDTAATVTSATGIANASGPKVVQPIAIQGSMIGRKEKNGPQGSGYSEDGTSFTLTKTDQHAVCSWNGDVTPKSSEDLSVTLRSQQGGEGVGVAHGFYPTAGQDCPSLNELSPAMKAADPVGVAQMNPTVYQEDGKTVEGMCAMRGATMVRRLTPMECERLQGFPDGWTSKRCILELEGNRWKPTGKVEDQKDGPRYRQMGNAVSVPVAEYIGRRMAEAVDG
jgi:DNA (cytosine-5)-methyltransferase 1